MSETDIRIVQCPLPPAPSSEPFSNSSFLSSRRTNLLPLKMPFLSQVTTTTTASWVFQWKKLEKRRTSRDEWNWHSDRAMSTPSCPLQWALLQLKFSIKQTNQPVVVENALRFLSQITTTTTTTASCVFQWKKLEKREEASDIIFTKSSLTFNLSAQKTLLTFNWHKTVQKPLSESLF